MTAIPSAPPLLAERTDIHKSCKAIESLLNILDDYSQVAGAMAALEKKLAKAMRELAGSKVTGDIAASAFNTSANLFEALADISTKFAKITDKEYDGIGAEVRKWFRKLAREEKAHDERLSNANARIKQASQAYEKKSKKNSRDSAEEHVRYINLVSTLRPEISKDKYDHGIYITRQHILTTYSVAACLARLADAEWVRVCESLRRFSPNIGPLGEWRALCEGGWERPLPRELPDIDAAETDQNILDPGQRMVPGSSKQELFVEQREQFNNVHPSYDSPTKPGNPLLESGTYTRHDSLAYISTSSGQDLGNQSADSSPLQPPRPLVDPNTGSVRSLSAFPPPPTHFPIPPPRSVTFQPTHSALNPNNITTSPQNDDIDELSAPGAAATQGAPPDSSPVSRSMMRPQSPEYSNDTPTSESTARATEFGVTSGSSSSSYVAAMRDRYTSSSGTISPQPKDIPRLPTSVADLATRYQPPESPPLPSQFRRSSLLIRRQNNNDLAQNEDSSYSQGTRVELGQETTAANNEKRYQFEAKEKERQLFERERELELKAKEIERQREELAKARQDITKQSPTPSGLSAFAQQLIPRSRERKISLRRQQQQLPSPSNQTDRLDSPSSPTRHSYHSANSSLQGPAPLTPSSSSSAQQGHHLLRSQQSQQSFMSTSPSQPPSPTLTRSQNANYAEHGPHGKDQHPSYCACEWCTSKHGQPAPSSHSLRPPEQPITLRPNSASSGGSNGGRGGDGGGKRSGVGEKSKGGWMRRLSMPVVMGHALNLDSSSSSSKKSQREGSASSNSLYALGAGIGNTPISNYPQSRGGGLFSSDGKRNASATNLRLAGGPGVLVREDGKFEGRRDYEANFGGKRSMTNLGLSGKR